MKILVTGANGYIGSKVVSKLLDYGNDVIAVDVESNHIDSRATVITCNIFEEPNPYEKYGNPDVCLHMAWRDGFVHNSPNHILDLSSHFSFLKKLIDSGIKKISVMGTMHEAGYFEGEINELDKTNPLSLYGIAKDSLRRCLKNYSETKSAMFQWLRAFYIYGNDDFGNSIFCKIRQSVKDGKKTFPFTTGEKKYDFIHIDELVKYISLAVMQDEILGEINVCSGKPISLGEQVEWYISSNNLPIKLQYGVFKEREYDSPCLYGSNKKIMEILDNYEKNNEGVL